MYFIFLFSSKSVKIYILLKTYFCISFSLKPYIFNLNFATNYGHPLLRISWLMRQKIIFLSLFFSYCWFSYISLFFSLLRIFELFLPMTLVFKPLFFLLLVLLHFILFLFVADLRVVPSYDVGLWDLWQIQEFESFDYELWIMIFLISIFNLNNNIYLF